jgi:hypothetical protein
MHEPGSTPSLKGKRGAHGTTCVGKATIEYLSTAIVITVLVNESPQKQGKNLGQRRGHTYSHISISSDIRCGYRVHKLK